MEQPSNPFRSLDGIAPEKQNAAAIEDATYKFRDADGRVHRAGTTLKNALERLAVLHKFAAASPHLRDKFPSLMPDAAFIETLSAWLDSHVPPNTKARR